MFKNYFKTAFRNLLHNKIYSFINIVGLSLGLACATLIMLYVNDEVSYDRFHKNVSRIYRIDKQNIKEDGSSHYGSYTGYLQGPRFTANIPEIQSFVRFEPGQVDVKAGADVQSQSVSFVDSNFFSVFSFPLSSGDANSVLTQPNSVVITEEMAKKYFGGSNAVGKIMLVNEAGKFIPHTVTAVAKDCPENSSIQIQVLLPLKVSAVDESNNGNWFNYFLTTFVVLTPHADIRLTQAKMDKFFKSDASTAVSNMQPGYVTKSINISFALEPITDIHLGKMVPDADEILSNRSDSMYSYIISAIALFILLIACINFINLTIARSVKRA